LTIRGSRGPVAWELDSPESPRTKTGGRKKGVTLIVRHAGLWSPAVCLTLARATSGGTILFEF